MKERATDANRWKDRKKRKERETEYGKREIKK